MLKLKEDKFKPEDSIILFGYTQYFHILKKLYENKRLPKIILLSGEKGLGKFTFAFHLINSFLAEKNKAYDLNKQMINTESKFYKNIIANINENFIYIGKNDLVKVSVNEIREIKKKFNTTSLNNLPRFTILDDAELLNPNSANALLKLIEEPSRSNYFILINNQRKKILETLRSRSIEIKIFLNIDIREKILKNLVDKFNIDLGDYKDFITKTTPGTLIRVCDCLEQLKIINSKDLYSSIEILLDKFKKDKSEIYLEAIKFLLDFQINRKLKTRDYDPVKTGYFKRKISKLLYEYENFNLSKNSILESFKELPDHA